LLASICYNLFCLVTALHLFSSNPQLFNAFPKICDTVEDAIFLLWRDAFTATLRKVEGGYDGLAEVERILPPLQ